MQVENHLLNEIHAIRYKGENPKYALVISHGIASHAGIYDRFCEVHAAKGAELWSYDAPGHGKSTTNRARGQWTIDEWVDAGVSWAEYVKELTGLPVILLGSSMGVCAAYSGGYSDAVSGMVLMGSTLVPGSPFFNAVAPAWRSPEVATILNQLGLAARLDINMFFSFDEDYGFKGAGQQKMLDPLNTWSYDLASWASLFQYDPKVSPAENTKPIFYASGENDPTFPPELVKATADGIGGPVTHKLYKDAGHQLMLFHTNEFSDDVHKFALDII